MPPQRVEVGRPRLKASRIFAVRHLLVALEPRYNRIGPIRTENAEISRDSWPHGCWASSGARKAAEGAR